MEKYLLLSVVLAVALIISIGINIIQSMLYSYNITAYREELMELAEYADSLEDSIFEIEEMEEIEE